MLGSGRVFPVEEERIRVEPFPIPEHWPQLVGVDFGYDHPFAAVHCILDMLERMQTGRWKVFSTCGMWFGEFRLYHRDEGRLVKLQDDLISASRYALMMKRFAISRPKRRGRDRSWENVPHAWMR